MSMENENEMTQETVPAESKKKTGNPARKMLMIAIILVLVIIAGATQAAAMENAAAKLFMSPEEYYQYVESKNAGKTSEGIASLYESIFKEELQVFDRSSQAEYTLHLGPDAMALLEMASDADLEFLDNAGFVVSGNSKKDALQVNIGAKVSGKELITGETTLDMKEGMVYFRIPQLTEKYLSVEMDELEGMEESMDMETLQETFRLFEELYEKTPEKKEVEKLLEKYMKLVISCVDEVEKEENDVLAAGDAAAKYTKLTVTLDGDVLKDMLELVLETMEEDKELQKLIEKSFTIEDVSDGEEIYEDFSDAVSDMLDALDYFSMDEEELEMSIWVDRNGAVCGRSFTYESDYDSFELSYAVVREGTKIGAEFEVEINGVKARLAGTGKVKGGAVTGELDVKVAGIKLAEIAFEDIKAGRDSFSGSFILTPSEELSEMILEEIPIEIGEVGLKLDVKTKKQKNSMTISVLLDEEVFAGVTIASETGAGKKISIPKEKNCIQVEDEEDLLDYLSEMDADKLLNSMEEAGLPDEFIEGVEELFDLLK